jgi:hypothetical protein
MAEHTKEELAEWVRLHAEKRAQGAQTLSAFYNKPKPALQNRVNIFLHRFDNFATQIIDGDEMSEDRQDLNRLYIYNIFKGWASALVGVDAPPSDVILGGYDVLIGYVTQRLGL